MEDDRQTDDQTGAIEAAGCDVREGGVGGWGHAERAPLALGGGVTAPRLDMCTRVEMKIGATC